MGEEEEIRTSDFAHEVWSLANCATPWGCNVQELSSSSPCNIHFKIAHNASHSPFANEFYLKQRLPHEKDEG